MSLFNSLFGASKYSLKTFPLTEIEVRSLVSEFKINTLDTTEESIVEKEIIKNRINGKISLRKIHLLLSGLQRQNKISKYDKEKLMKVFKEFSLKFE